MASKTIKDYYALLGISSNATQEEIRLAFRQMARTYHPDINSAPDAEARFREVNEAYEILADPEKRKSYDFFAVSPEDTATPPQPEAPLERESESAMVGLGAGGIDKSRTWKLAESLTTFGDASRNPEPVERPSGSITGGTTAPNGQPIFS